VVVRASGLSKTFRGPDGRPVPVLEGVDVEVGAGEFVAVAGPSGSGKSTLLNLLGLLEPLDAGEIWFDQTQVSALPRRAQCPVRGRSIGYVFQSFLLISALTALDNVLLAARYVGRSRREALPEARALMERLGVAHRSGHYPAQLSGGEQQRVAIARAVVNRPKLVLADEPTANLDDAAAATVVDLLAEQAARHGATLVLATHDARVKGKFRERLELAVPAGLSASS